MRSLRDILYSDDVIVSAGVYDPLSALTAQHMGFSSAILPGWTLGALLGVTEPLTTLTETAEIARNICSVADIPLSVDVGAGFGNATMVKRCVKSFEEAGVQAIHLEDQVVPKRIDYHQGKHYIVSIDEMMLKLECALKARKSRDMLIIARTDAGRNEDETFENAIERANIFGRTGVDLVKVFARNEEEMIAAPKRVKYPLWYVASEGLGRPIPTPEEAKQLGYKAISYPQTAIQSAFLSIRQAYRDLFENGRSGIEPKEAEALSREILSLVHK